MTAIELNNVRKEFGSFTALDGVNLTVQEGEIYGFLGPNGAGKSTTINIVLDFLRPTAGGASVFGMNCQQEPLAIKNRIGVLPEGYDVYNRLTGRQHVEFAIDAKDADDDPVALLNRVGLTDDMSRKAGGYSKGMKQRLLLAMSLVDDPDLLILDEPTTGLDPNGARKMRELIRQENDRGATVFFSSHILSQVEAVCDRVGILRDGRLVAQDDIDSLRQGMNADTTLTIRIGGSSEGAVSTVEGIDGVSNARLEGDELIVSCQSQGKTTVLNALEDAGYEVLDFSTEEASLEQLFEAYTTDTQEVEA